MSQSLSHKPNLLLLHGALGHSSHFDLYIPLLKSHYEVYTLLFEGHGNTVDQTTALEVTKLVEQVHQFINQNQLKDVMIFGYSLGGYVALCLQLAYPDYVKKIITLGTKFVWNEVIAAQELRFLNPDVIETKVPQLAVDLQVTHGSEYWKMVVEQVKCLIQTLGVNPILSAEHLVRINIPVQIMVGDEDKMVSFEESISAVQSLPNAAFVVMPSTQHPIQKVRVKLLVDLMNDFFLSR